MAVKDIGIYFPEDNQNIFKYHLNNIAGRASEYWSYYTDSDVFNSSQHERRIAFFHVPFPYSSDFEKQIDAIYKHAHCIIILASELHPVIINFIRKYDYSKIWYFTCGMIQNPKLLNAHTYNHFDWFKTSVHFYKYERPSTLHELNPYDVKPLAFDALLGRKKPHRSQAFNFINSNKLNDQCIMTYINDYHVGVLSGDKSRWQWETPGLENYENAHWTVDRVKYYGYPMSISQIIPIDIYNQTAYSLVCETNFENGYVFFTEKTVKPMLAQRLFIMLSHQHTLKQLQELGFKTFHGIIDESYDDIEPPIHRHEAALEQLKWLCGQDQRTILDKCKPILEHNFNLMYKSDWYHEFTGTVSRLLFD